MGPIEIITSVQKRRRWTPGEKKAIVEEAQLRRTAGKHVDNRCTMLLEMLLTSYFVKHRLVVN